ncbi:EKC/KEOPS complex subunit LAGE3 isoform X2 [Ochotona curzoniae]|uniref:EKC/KEOPS complex subunit LAGE3 isoform X2 n=1 Tax=Ochotona curzoniae TaxID=130825 RepID=UPI001B351071|nr:EKC/KEOPS complex subunit LAGE3 isoform X2 [Ochotona curzoniae]
MQAADGHRRRARGFPSGSDAETAASGGIQQVAPAAHVPVPGGDVATAASRPGMRTHLFTLSVPFPTHLEAEIARESLAPDAEPHHEAIGKDLAPVDCKRSSPPPSVHYQLFGAAFPGGANPAALWAPGLPLTQTN